MIYRSKAPLRIGFAGGGTDVSPYSDKFGGAILNATISLSAKASLELINENKIIFHALDRGEIVEFDLARELPVNGELDLLKGAYNYMAKHYITEPRGFRLSTYVDAPAGSGLGSSSTLMVAILGTFVEWLSLPLGAYDIAHIAYEIERTHLKMAGGKQDQYAATFGGFNYMEFYADDKVIVNPLRIHKPYVYELENNLLLYYTSKSRVSSTIIEEQQKNVTNKNEKSLEAMHVIKEQAREMKEALLKGNINRIGEILDEGFRYKKEMAKGISNPMIDEIYETAKRAGAVGGKILGAGGGGFMLFYCPDISKYKVMHALEPYEGQFNAFRFVEDGLFTWFIK
ncbi:MAG: dehydrogenase [Ferruginibacter sp.]